jgi:hypothetical protein
MDDGPIAVAVRRPRVTVEIVDGDCVEDRERDRLTERSIVGMLVTH